MRCNDVHPRQDGRGQCLVDLRNIGQDSSRACHVDITYDASLNQVLQSTPPSASWLPGPGLDMLPELCGAALGTLSAQIARVSPRGSGCCTGSNETTLEHGQLLHSLPRVLWLDDDLAESLRRHGRWRRPDCTGGGCGPLRNSHRPRFKPDSQDVVCEWTLKKCCDLPTPLSCMISCTTRSGKKYHTKARDACPAANLLLRHVRVHALTLSVACARSRR